MRKRLLAAAAALIVTAIVALAIFHNGAARFAVSMAGLAMGYDISSTDFRLESRHGALTDVRITRGGEPVLRARRIDVYYDLRDLLPGSKHRFGLSAIAIDRPQITIIHHRDGSYNIAVPRAVSGGTRGPARANGVPLAFTIRIRDASVALIDQYRFYKGSRSQRIDAIDAGVSIDTATRTKYLVKGQLEDRGPQPFRLAGTIDYEAGYAFHHITVRAIPISTIGNYFINSPAAHILSGTVHSFDMQAWAFAPELRRGGHGPLPANYDLSGSGRLSDGTMIVSSLDAPIRNIEGPIEVFGSGFAASHMTAQVGHIPIVFSGGIFNFKDPQFRLGVDGRGDLRYLKEVAHFANGLPIFGAVRIHALIEGDLSNPILLIGFSGKRFYYQRVPIDDPHGDVALYRSNLVVLPFHAYYSGIKMHVEGNLALGKTVNSVLALHAIGSSTQIPYLSAMLAPQPILTEVLLNGVDLKVNARGIPALDARS